MLYTLEQLMEFEEAQLKPYAVTTRKSKGRQYKEHSTADRAQEELALLVFDDKPARLAFQKDRDRIMHSRAFRRLKGKTQVFVADYGDHFRTRMSHSIEVAQVSRDIARSMGLNEDLAESIALAHDLGHTPFGHAGQDTLNECMREFGPDSGLTTEQSHFEHNDQSLRIVDKLENIYPTFRGLNLSFEVREGMMKHQTSWDNQGKTIIAHPSLEAQIVNLGDEIAYNNHDVDDGLRAGIITLEELSRLELWQKALELTHLKYGGNLAERHLVSRTVSNMISLMIADALIFSTALIEKYDIKTLEDVYAQEKPLIDFSPKMKTMSTNLKSFLTLELYFSREVRVHSERGQEVIRTLFEYYVGHEKEFLKKYENGSDSSASSENAECTANEPLVIMIKDYIAGMTDEFAREECERVKKGLRDK